MIDLTFIQRGGWIKNNRIPGNILTPEEISHKCWLITNGLQPESLWSLRIRMFLRFLFLFFLFLRFLSYHCIFCLCLAHLLTHFKCKYAFWNVWKKFKPFLSLYRNEIRITTSIVQQFLQAVQCQGAVGYTVILETYYLMCSPGF